MKIQAKELVVIKNQLINGGSNSTLTYDKDKVLFLRLLDVSNDELYYEFSFDGVVAFRHFTEGFSFISESYEKLIEICNSDWLKELRKMMPDRFDFCEQKHFAIYTENDGQYEIIAKDCSIREIK